MQEDILRRIGRAAELVIYSQVLKGAEYMSIAHAITIAKQIDYLGRMPTATPLSVRISDDARVMRAGWPAGCSRRPLLPKT